MELSDILGEDGKPLHTINLINHEELHRPTEIDVANAPKHLATNEPIFLVLEEPEHTGEDNNGTSGVSEEIYGTQMHIVRGGTLDEVARIFQSVHVRKVIQINPIDFLLLVKHTRHDTRESLQQLELTLKNQLLEIEKRKKKLKN